MKTKLFFTAVVLSAMTVIATGQTSQTAQQVQPGQGQAAGNAWIDSDNDGVCDNFENGTRPGRRAYSAGENQAAVNRGPGKGQGLAQGPRNGHPRGQGMMPGRGAGRGQGVAPGRGLHNGQGPAFVDANKDGVCDNLATTPEKK